MDDEQPGTATATARPSRRAQAAYAALGVALLVGELVAASSRPALPGAGGGAHQALAVLLGLTVAVARWRPAVGLGLLVLVSLGQVATGADLALDVVALVVVSFQCARRGSAATMWVSGAYVPAAGVLGGFYATVPGTGLVDQAQRTAPAGDLLATTTGWAITLAPLFVPWLLGLTLRMRARAEESRRLRLRAEAERSIALARQAQAEALARAEEQRARLANDVHDVVGHSLAVILAQAQSADYLSERPSQEVLGILHAIAESARSSLHEVRNVLLPTGGEPEASHGLDDLLARVPVPPGGLRRHLVGTPRPLAPDTSVLARRVLQEMLTNALKHGDPEGGMEVTIQWGSGLTLAVRNAVRPDTQLDAERRGDEPAAGGLGLGGMRRRLESAGGRLAVEEDARSFCATATVPLAGARTVAEQDA